MYKIRKRRTQRQQDKKITHCSLNYKSHYYSGEKNVRAEDFRAENTQNPEFKKRIRFKKVLKLSTSSEIMDIACAASKIWNCKTRSWVGLVYGRWKKREEAKATVWWQRQVPSRGLSVFQHAAETLRNWIRVSFSFFLQTPNSNTLRLDLYIQLSFQNMQLLLMLS